MTEEVKEKLEQTPEQKETYDMLGISDDCRQAILQSKARGEEPVFTRISGKEFVYKPVSRNQWRELRERMATAAASVEDSEAAAAELREQELEHLVRMCEVYYENSETLYAGVIDSLSDSILLSSGFGGVEVDPVRL